MRRLHGSHRVMQRTDESTMFQRLGLNTCVNRADMTSAPAGTTTASESVERWAVSPTYASRIVVISRSSGT
jgi:hypothetical protein